ncbi:MULTISPECIES: hypothetical protein [Clostridium]|uniref:Uncharacterized protein n=1 Tax=Clostridium senegalense TaxID=1465809 RepID=A0A6M0GZG6_9CLOT|nr:MULTISPECIES: hypothetical protein [Clostridium]NEU03597.1 hypothetical protein [Clostridium senegalense]
MSCEVKKFLLLYLKTLGILIFMGIILPNVLETTIYFFTKNTRVYENSILVGRNVDKPLEVLYNYIYIFKNFVGF